jgi:hypothetical protein
LLEEGVVLLFAVLFGEAEGLDAFDEDLGGVGLNDEAGRRFAWRRD